jgi:hypothetical protein
MAQTLPRVDDYADWGFGQFWYHTGYQALDISGVFHALTDGVSLAGAVVDVVVSGNTFECGRYLVAFSVSFSYLGYVGVINNKVRRTPFGGVVFANHLTTVKHGKLEIRDNDIDLDPLFESANRGYVNGNNGTCTFSGTTVTFTSHGLYANTAVRFTNSGGALPASITASGTVGARSYYVKEVLTANTFSIATYAGGDAITFATAGTGTHTCFASIPNGTWTTADSKPYIGDFQDWSVTNITGNRLRNLNVALLTDGDTEFGHTSGNVLYMQPASGATLPSPSNSSNTGIQNPGALLRSGMLVYEDCTPTSSTYGQVLNPRYSTGWQTAIPATGFYLAGEIVWNATYTVATQTIGASTPQYALIGWVRIATGSGHVLNTDWREIRALTGQ